MRHLGSHLFFLTLFRHAAGFIRIMVGLCQYVKQSDIYKNLLVKIVAWWKDIFKSPKDSKNFSHQIEITPQQVSWLR